MLENINPELQRKKLKFLYFHKPKMLRKLTSQERLIIDENTESSVIFSRPAIKLRYKFSDLARNLSDLIKNYEFDNNKYSHNHLQDMTTEKVKNGIIEKLTPKNDLGNYIISIYIEFYIDKNHLSYLLILFSMA